MTGKEFTKKLHNKKIYILSPHFDDAILSLGMLIYALKEQADIHIINIFTTAHEGPYTFSAKRFIKSSGFANAHDLYQERNTTDKEALSFVGAKRINIGLQDALFRKKTHTSLVGNFIPEYNHVYPTYALHIIRHVSEYDPSPHILERKLARMVPSDAVIFVPFGIGNHADHVITREIARKLFHHCCYYLDFPYFMHAQTNITLPTRYLTVSLPVNYHTKKKEISFYQSQLSNLFTKNVIPTHQELFIIPAHI